MKHVLENHMYKSRLLQAPQPFSKSSTMTRWNTDKIHYLTGSELTRSLSVIKRKRDRALGPIASGCAYRK
jgi:hypothetical protein